MGSREEKVWKGNLKENREGNGSRKIKKVFGMGEDTRKKCEGRRQ